MPVTVWKSLTKINVRDAALNPGGTNLQYAPSIAALTGGGFVVGWADESDPTGLGAPDITGRTFSADGTASSNEFLLSSLFFDGPQVQATVAGLPGNKFVSLYQTEDQVFSTTAQNVSYEIYTDAVSAPVYRPNATPVNPANINGIFQTDNETDPAVTAFAGGGFFVAYVDDSSGNDDIRGFVVDASNTEQTSFMIDGAATASSAPAVATLTNGKVVVVSQSAAASQNIRYAIVSSNGSVDLSGDVAATASAETAPAVAALTGGGFAVTWVDADGNAVGNAGIQCAIYSAAGVFQIAFIANQTTTAGQQSAPTITGLSDGSLLVAWIDGPSGDVRARQFSSAGVALDTEFTMATLEAGSDPKLVMLSDGRVALAVADTATNGNADVFSAIWDPRGIVISGTVGDDSILARLQGGTIDGLGGNDTLTGFDGVDIFIGGAGADTMVGGGGSDLYYVDNASDIASEALNQGNADRVLTSVSYTLTALSQIELFSTNNSSGVGAINLTGNDFANQILGNNGANIIDGGRGTDRMTGLSGNDLYYVDSFGDTVFEVAGGGTADRVLASGFGYTLAADQQIELISTTNTAGRDAIDLTGNNIANRILGNSGVNVINGGLANDFLTGAAGADKFLFNTTISGGLNIDTIADFVHLTDDIQLAQAIFTGIGPTLDATELRLGASATTTTQRIVYDSVTGNMFFDSDGSGVTAQVQFAKVTSGTVIDINDFIMV